MFKVEPVYVKDTMNDGDLFTITCSRKELKLLETSLEVFKNRDQEVMDIWQAIVEELY